MAGNQATLAKPQVATTRITLATIMLADAVFRSLVLRDWSLARIINSTIISRVPRKLVITLCSVGICIVSVVIAIVLPCLDKSCTNTEGYYQLLD